ncbi:MAG: hypothetical protein ACRCY3_01865, partial [Sphingorhabdus sp.]
GFDPEAAPNYGRAVGDNSELLTRLNILAKHFGKRELARLLHMPLSKLHAKLHNHLFLNFDASHITRLENIAMQQQSKKQKMNKTWQSSVREIGLRATARKYALDASNLRRYLNTMH